MRKVYLACEQVETVYFGGGTPSLLSIEECQLLINTVRSNFSVASETEITLEANPDDITEEKLTGWRSTGINRLSIGVQSFFDEDLQWMNRAHTAKEAMDNLQLAIKQFDNITIDLIYGFPLLSDKKWKQNVETAIRLNISHLSCYALTVEPKTPLQKMIREHKTENVDPDKQAEQLLLLMEWMEKAGYEHYEISNFAKPCFRSRHNSSYWQGKKYLGIGPSAHSFDGAGRQWNVSNNNIYIESVSKEDLTFEKEILTETQKLNEYIMTSLRTMEGLNLQKVGNQESGVRNRSQKFINQKKMIEENNFLKLTKEGKLLADGIAAELFIS